MTAAARGRHYLSVTVTALGLAMISLATTATAQTVADPAAPAATAPAAMLSSAAAAQTTPAPHWELIGGYEGDRHGTGYGFFGPSYIHPLSSNLAFTARAFANYLIYEFDDGAGGLTKVNSPGLSTAAGIRIGGGNNLTLTAGPSFKRRNIETELANGTVIEESDNRIGFNFGAAVYANPAKHTNFHGIVDYGSADEYIWSRLALKQQVTNLDFSGDNSLHLGGEVILQGNDDIRSRQFGGLFEISNSPNSLSFMIRGGYKVSTFEFGEDKTGPYFGVGFYKAFR